jgi:hypothetical protein
MRALLAAGDGDVSWRAGALLTLAYVAALGALGVAATLRRDVT